MPDKETLCAYGLDFDAVAGWLGSYGGENSPLDISRGLFAGEVGVPRLLELFRDFGVHVTWFVPGHSVETFPEQSAAIVEAGHEVGLHGYSHENPIAMSPEQEEDVLDRCIELLEGLTGERPAGYVAPWWEFNAVTAELLLARGIEHDHSLMHDDFHPYYVRTGDTWTRIDYSRPAGHWTMIATLLVVAFAAVSAAYRKPEVLLLDEPLSALDTNLVVRMQGVLSRLQKDLGITFVYVTHSQSEAFAMADRVVIMNEGRIAQTGSQREVYRNPANRFVAEFVGTNNILTGRVCHLTEEWTEIETDLGRFQAAPSRHVHLEDEQPVTFVISADLVQLSGVETALENRIECGLISEKFVGSTVTLFLETAGGVEFKVQTSQRVLERLDLSGATALFASWAPEHVHILPGDAAARRK